MLLLNTDHLVESGGFTILRDQTSAYARFRQLFRFFATWQVLTGRGRRRPL